MMDLPPARLRGILFDLDGTLLQVDMQEFIPAYIAGLGRHFDDCVNPGRFARAMRDAIQRLFVPQGGAQGNRTRLLAHLAARLGLPAAAVASRFDRFAEDGLGDLASLVEPAPLARDILQFCFDRGWRVAIATNPVFPSSVVEARLRWAGIADFPFALVSSLENSRFCKPSPGYIHDLLACLELAPEECLMVGNDTEHDLAAVEAGIPTFLVDTWLVDRKGEFQADWRGGHPQLLEFLGGHPQASG